MDLMEVVQEVSSSMDNIRIDIIPLMARDMELEVERKTTME